MMTQPLEIIRLTEDTAGESHFDSVAVERELVPFAPPAVPFFATPAAKAEGYVVIRIPVGWVGELHRSPRYQMLFCWAGALRVTASDGGVRTIAAGDAWLMADNHGKGHASEVVSDVPFDAVIIQLPEPG